MYVVMLQLYLKIKKMNGQKINEFSLNLIFSPCSMKERNPSLRDLSRMKIHLKHV